jgi:hypothetical protein
MNNIWHNCFFIYIFLIVLLQEKVMTTLFLAKFLKTYIDSEVVNPKKKYISGMVG